MLELYRPANSYMHHTHARVKIIFTLAYILAVNLSPQYAWPAFILYFSIILSLIFISGLNIGFVLKRSLIALPFLISAIPLIFWGPGPNINVEITQYLTLPFSPIGLERCASILVKAWLSILAAIILTGTTTFQGFVSGFRKLHVPMILISIIEMMWRYLFVIVDEVVRLIRARNSRSSEPETGRGTGGSVFWRASVTGHMAGSLFLRSIERSERVYAAMLSRGYTGEPLEDPANGFTGADGRKLLVSIFLVFFVFLFGFLSGR